MDRQPAPAFLDSALSCDNPLNSTAEVLEWIRRRNREVEVRVERIALRQLRGWALDSTHSALRHSSGGFFGIEGINVRTNWGEIPDWDQPIINQPEIGFLGIITQEFEGKLLFLMQAKIEPGNVNNVQLSPTLQATKSNYTQRHRGRAPRYLEHFLDVADRDVLLDQLQSEQGARFLRKRNRNIIIRLREPVEIDDDFRWLTLGQIKELMRMDNIVNMDTRTVVSGISFAAETPPRSPLPARASRFLASELADGQPLHSFDQIIHWFTGLKVRYDLVINAVPLDKVRQWRIEADCIRHVEDRYFKVIGVHVEIDNREVSSWDQPLIEPAQQGICAFIAREIDGALHFLVQGKIEPGNFDILEMAPTVQCLTGSYANRRSRTTLPYLDYVLNARPEQIVLDSLQSEEGGRFFREQNRNMILLVDDDFPVEAPENYIWMTLQQLKTFIRFNNYLNIQARSLISMVPCT